MSDKDIVPPLKCQGCGDEFYDGYLFIKHVSDCSPPTAPNACCIEMLDRLEKKVYEKLDNPREVEKVFIEAFETPQK